MDEFVIRPFQPEDQAAVKNLILNGLVEHWGSLDMTKNPDLNDIANTYANAIFLVACCRGVIIATGACVPCMEKQAEIKRMSVHKDWRRNGLGTRILQELLTRARKAGFERIILETTETWTEVVAFYQGAGFQVTHYRDGDVYFALELN
ncbi:MAG: GNAT family N-acetyltransferase [Anaerolineales bacterium]|nr:GNAT family N-acetyltransferase [Anaerolineales bacterium]